jgi:hypothetical protein
VLRLIRSEINTLEARAFYANPHGHIDAIPDSTTHLVLFGDLVPRVLSTEGSVTFGTVLTQKGWKETWGSNLNGLDILQDEEERRGGIVVYQRKGR